MALPVLFVKKCVFSLTRTGEKAYNKGHKNSRWILSASVRSCRGFFSVAIPVGVVGKKKEGGSLWGWRVRVTGVLCPAVPEWDGRVEYGAYDGLVLGQGQFQGNQ